MATDYPIEEFPLMSYDAWLRDRVQEIRWDLGLDLETRPPKEGNDESI